MLHAHKLLSILLRMLAVVENLRCMNHIDMLHLKLGPLTRL